MTTELFLFPMTIQYIGSACDLLRHVKIICQSLWRKQVDMADEHRLNLVLRMLKCPHFNAKMNSLIEVGVFHFDLNVLY